MVDSESKISQILESDIAKVFKIAVFIFGVAGAYYYLQTQIALINQDILFIKENHLKHIEERLSANESDHKEILKQVGEINVNIAKIATGVNK